MRYLSVCSGIEAATVAWHPLGWTAAGFAEIEAFPSAVLAHHYPNVRNFGDFTLLRDQPWIVDADVLVGGTPCQAFSVAGLRLSLSDDRGNLSLEFIRLANAIDDLRSAAGREPCAVLWENVPGVLSTRDNAFGHFLAGLAGAVDPLDPPGRRWNDAGVVAGPKRTVAWRILDAQYFGLAQRRRRLFVVASAGGLDPVEVLFEREGVRRDTAPRRETGQRVAGTREARAGTGGADDNQAQAGHLIPQAYGGNDTRGPIDVATAVNAHGGPHGRLDFESETFIAHTLRGGGFDASEDRTGRGTPIVPVAFDARQSDVLTYGNMTGPLDTGGHSIAVAFSAKDHGADAADDLAPTLRAMGHADNHANGGGQLAVAFDTTQITSASNYSNPKPGDPCHPLAAGAHPPAVALLILEAGARTGTSTDDPRAGIGIGDDGDPMFTLQSGKQHAVAFDLRGREGGAQFEGPHDTASIRAASGGSSRSYVAQPAYSIQERAVSENLENGPGGKGWNEETAYTLEARNKVQAAATGMAVRRLTPKEAARLQGFPDDYLDITYRGKPAADGPKYKALGNSMAVPVMRWIGRRIQMVEAMLREVAA